MQIALFTALKNQRKSLVNKRTHLVQILVAIDQHLAHALNSDVFRPSLHYSIDRQVRRKFDEKATQETLSLV